MKWLSNLQSRFSKKSNEIETNDHKALSTPRPHHFQFGKVALPIMALSDPEWFVRTFSGSEGPLFLQNAWKNVGQEFAENERLAETGLQIDLRESAEMLRFLITLPLPLARNELYFSAILAPKADLSQLRIFGLEKMAAPAGTVAHGNLTVLVEWTKQGRLVYACNPPPDPVQFEQHVFAILAGEIEILTFTDLRPMGWFQQR